MKRTALPIGLLLCASLAHAESLHDIFTKGAVDRSVTVKIVDATTGVPSTDIVFNSTGIDLWYRREGAASVDVTEVTLAALTTAHTDGGFLHVNDGVYRLDLPDAAFATGANYVDFGGIVTGEIVIGGRVKLVNVNLEDAVRFGLSALPNAGADAAGGLPISDAGGLDLDALKVNVDDIETDTADMQPKLGTFPNLGSGTTLAGNLEDMRDNGTAAFDRATDSQQAVRDRGDAAWATATGFSTHSAADVWTVVTRELTGIGTSGIASAANVSAVTTAVLQALGVNVTTIASLTDQDTFTLTAGSADDDAYNGWALLIIDASTSAQREVGWVSDYTGSTRTVQLDADPGIFTAANGDTVVLMPAFLASPVTVDGASVRDIVIEDQGGGVSLGCAIAVVLAYASGDLVTSAGSSTYEDPSGTETRATGTVSTPGNRTAAITCPTY